jgi:uncharacterized membrane protein
MKYLSSSWSDHRIETIMGNLLRAGVVLSAAVVLIGAGVYLKHQGHMPAQYGVFRGEPTDLRSVKSILTAASARDGSGIIQLGLLLLIATPVARVVFSVLAFAIQRDRLYVAATLVVLAVLAFSLTGANL